MPDHLLEEINQIKKDMVVAFTRYSISGEDAQNMDAILNSVLLSWFDSIHSSHDFYQKYGVFKQLEKMILNSMLFDMVDTISSPKDALQANHAVSIYRKVIQDENYQQLSNGCGYKLPNEFGNAPCYYDGSLKQNVQFFRLFGERLDTIFSDLSKKGGNMK